MTRENTTGMWDAKPGEHFYLANLKSLCQGGIDLMNKYEQFAEYAECVSATEARKYYP